MAAYYPGMSDSEGLKANIKDGIENFEALLGHVGTLKKIKPIKKVKPDTFVLIYTIKTGPANEHKVLEGDIGFVKDVRWRAVVPLESLLLHGISADKAEFRDNELNIRFDKGGLARPLLYEKAFSIPVVFDERHARITIYEDGGAAEFLFPETAYGLLDGNSNIALGKYDANEVARKFSPEVGCAACDFMRYLSGKPAAGKPI